MTPFQLAQLTIGEVCDRYAAGTIGQVSYEAYRRAWAIAGGARLGYRHADGWMTPSENPWVEELAARLVDAARRGRDRLPFEAAA